MLQKALDVEATDVQPLIEAIYWLESAYLLETLNATTQRAAQQQYHGAAYGAPAINVGKSCTCVSVVYAYCVAEWRSYLSAHCLRKYAPPCSRLKFSKINVCINVCINVYPCAHCRG